MHNGNWKSGYWMCTKHSPEHNSILTSKCLQTGGPSCNPLVITWLYGMRAPLERGRDNAGNFAPTGKHPKPTELPFCPSSCLSGLSFFFFWVSWQKWGLSVETASYAWNAVRHRRNFGSNTDSFCSFQPQEFKLWTVCALSHFLLTCLGILLWRDYFCSL